MSFDTQIRLKDIVTLIWTSFLCLQEPESARPYYKRIGQHFEQVKNHEDAERYYIKADMVSTAVEMHTRAGKWELAHKLAMGYLTDDEMHVRS